jgi:WD40 repeat protein
MPNYQLFTDAAFSADGLRLATLGLVEQDQVSYDIHIYDAKTQKELSTLRRSSFDSHDLNVWIGYCDEDRRLVLKLGHKVGSTVGSYVEVCDASSGETAFTVDDVNGPPAISRDGKCLATIHHGGLCHIWETATGRRQAVTTPTNAGATVQSVAFSADGRQLAQVGSGGIAIFEVESGKELRRFRPGLGCDLVAFSADGARLATGSGSGVITLWDPVSGQEVLMLRGHGGAIVALSFSPDGRFLCSASADGSVKVWEAAPGQ